MRQVEGQQVTRKVNSTILSQTNSGIVLNITDGECFMLRPNVAYISCHVNLLVY